MPTVVYDRLLQAGVPPLPHDMSYRVKMKHSSISGHTLRVELRQAEPKWWNKDRTVVLAHVLRHPFYLNDFDAYGDPRAETAVESAFDIVASACMSLARDHEESMRISRLLSEYAELEGDHP